MNNTGMNTAESDSVIEMIVKPISLDAIQRRLHRRFADFHVAHDVFEHDDGVIHDEADAQCQRHQRKIVEAVTEQCTSPRTCR